MKRDYNLYLKDILNAMESIQTFIKDMHFEEFKEDDNSRLKGE